MKAYRLRIEEGNKKSTNFKTANIPAGITFSELSFILDEILGLSGTGELSFIFKKLGVIFEEGIGDLGLDEGKYTYEDATLEHINFPFDIVDECIYICSEEKEHKYKIAIEEITETYREHYPAVVSSSMNYPAHHIERLNQKLKEKYFYVHKNNQEIFKDEIYEAFQDGNYGIFYLTEKELIDVDIEAPFDVEETLKAMQTDFYDELDFKTVLMELYNKNELYQFSRLKGLKGVSALKKDALANKIIETMLSPEEVERYFIYMSDQEIKTFEKAVATEKLFIPEDDDVIETLMKSGYAVPFGFLGLYISPELKKLYNSINNSEFHQKREKKHYFYCCLKAGINLYGIMPMDIFIQLLYRNTKLKYTQSEIETELYRIPEDISGWFIRNNTIYDKDFVEHDYGLLEVQGDKSFYIPSLDEILKYGTRGYDESSFEMKKMVEYFCERDYDEAMAITLAGTIQRGIRMGQDMDFIFDLLEDEEIPIENEKELNIITECIMEFWNNTRMQINRGFKPSELARNKQTKRKRTSHKNNVIDFNKAKKKYEKK